VFNLDKLHSWGRAQPTIQFFVSRFDNYEQQRPATMANKQLAEQETFSERQRYFGEEAAGQWCFQPPLAIDCGV
jgi:hypothetical protein